MTSNESLRHAVWRSRAERRCYGDDVSYCEAREGEDVTVYGIMAPTRRRLPATTASRRLVTWRGLMCASCSER